MTRLHVAVTALGLALAVGGCAGEPDVDVADPTAGPTSSSAAPTSAPPSSSGTPSETATTEPEVLSPEETVRAWVKARNWLLKSGDEAAVQALSASACVTCRDLTDGITQVYVNGGYFRTKGWVVNGAKRKPDFLVSREVSSALVFSAGTSQTTAGAKPVHYVSERNFLDFTLDKVDGRWLVTEVVFVE